MEYFKKRSIALNYYGVILSHDPMNALLVIEGDSGFHTIEQTNIPMIDRKLATKEEFEAAYTKAINSFKPFIEAADKP
jgi:hypothetical protein